jgi:hypothetical protein
MKKEIKLEKEVRYAKLISWILIILFIILATIVFIKTKYITGRVIEVPASPTDCSESAISALWDFVFKESSVGITISTNSTESNRCNFFLANKTRGEEVWLLYGFDMPSFPQEIRSKGIIALKANLTAQGLSNISQILDPDYSSQILIERQLTKEQASAQLQSIFKTGILTLNTTINNGETSYFYEEEINQTSKTNFTDRITTYTISANQSLESFMVLSFEGPIICSANWTNVTLSCTSNETQIIWFNDTSSCENVTRPTNRTIPCDYDKNGIIGNIADINLDHVDDFGFKIGGTIFNISKNYSGTLSLQIEDNGTAIMTSSYNFQSPLNLKNLTIKKQSSNSNIGYIIIDGLDREKTVYLDRIAGFSQVCIKNTTVDAISSISRHCTDDEEILLSCPGSMFNSSLTCNITSNRFVVSGIAHSGVIEMNESEDSACTSDWQCTNWSSCALNVSTRICTDLNTCSSTKNETRQCSLEINAIYTAQNQDNCTPVWNCTNWAPEKCAKGLNQTRTCTSLNDCTNSPLPLQRECQEKKLNNLIIMISVILGIMILVIVGLIAYYMISALKPEEIQINEA